MLPFTPWSTLRDQIDLLDLIAAKELIDSVDPVQLSIRLLVPPGSLLLALPEMHEHLQRVRSEGFSHLWHHPDPRMDRLQADIAAAGRCRCRCRGARRRSTHHAIRRITAAAAADAGVRVGCAGHKGVAGGAGRASPVERAVVLLR